MSAMDGKNRLTDELRGLVAKQAARLEQQAARIAELNLVLANAKRDSSTSSKPPSSGITTPKSKKTSGGRKKPRRGGQPAREQQLRELLPERVDETLDDEIHDGNAKRFGLTPTGDVEVIQHIVLPEAPGNRLRARD